MTDATRTEIKSIWFEIGTGPLLDAAKAIFDNLNRQDAVRGKYQVGDQRWEKGQRYIEIICETRDAGMIAKLSA